MLYNSKCSAILAFLCYNFILFFSIQVSGHPPAPRFPFLTPPEFPPLAPELPPGLPGFLPPPFPGFLPPIQGLRLPDPRLLAPPPPSVQEICPKNEVTMKIVCANVIGIPALPVSRLLNPLSSPCCKYIEGLLYIEVANCFCRAITFTTSDPKTNIPASLVTLLNYCQKELPRDFRCATSSTSA